MCIKYSDCSKGYVYGSDGKQANNWNPDCDYGNEYVRVYFRIDTPSYHYSNGFDTEDNRNKWNAEASHLIESFGILEDCGYAVEHSKDKRAYLHAHPQEISGVVLKNDVRKITEAISSMELSSIRWVDLYETVYDITDEEYSEILTTKNDEIRSAILDVCKTTRTTKFCYVEEVVRVLSNRFRLRRIGENDGRTHGIGQTGKHITKIINSLVSEGYLVSAGDGELVRTINKAEQKKAKLFID